MGHTEEEKPLISVIVPVYNGQDYLRACIESIEGQTYNNLEIIVVNDGSSDGTGDLCRRLGEEYDNIEIIEMNDEGVSAARNAGLGRMGGEFVTFVDADDRILPDMIEKLYDCIIETGSEIAGCGFFSWKEENEFADAEQSQAGMRQENQDMELPARIYTVSEFIEDGILKGNSRCWSKLYRASGVGETRFRLGLTIGEDMLFLVDMLPNIKRIGEIPYKGYGYFQNPKGAMNRAFLPQYMDQITCWETAREKIAEIKGAKGREQITAILIMAVLLTAGKIAMLPAGERKMQADFVRVCHGKLKKELLVPGAYEGLSGGYKLKAKIFAAVPWVYLRLYHLKAYKK
ncbi:putative glycosyltransferase EpsH [Lachnospiraceae bacterium]|nr:putative glycosyltransferase EpsH [Lachnospiraceae bacterium]